MIVLSVNAGSSSLKFTAFQMPEANELINGYLQKIGLSDSFYIININGVKTEKARSLPNHEEAIKVLLEELLENKIIESYDEIGGIGHRVVHGGDKYSESVVIDDLVLNAIEKLSDLAPLHNPANIVGIKAFRSLLPNVKNIAVFDTAFHQTMKETEYLYPVPYEWYEEFGVRKYGFHGTSHKYVSMKISEELDRNDLKVISCHLGNGGSLAAIDCGKVVNTTMGFTPLAGLVMGTRSGDIDESIIPYVMNKTGKNVDELISDLNKKSGLLGISGISSDARDIQAAIDNGNERAMIAREMYERSIVNFISSYYVLLGGADVIIFTAGIGENDMEVRKNIMNKLKPLGVEVDIERNKVRSKFTRISSDSSRILCYVVPTNEELMIARDTYGLIG